MEELRVYYSGGTKWKLKTQLVILVLLHENIIIWNWWLIIIIIHSFCYSFLLIDIYNYQLRWMDSNLNVRFLHTIFSCLLHFWVPSKYYYMRNYSYSVQVVQICTGAFWLDHFSLLYRVLAVLDTYCQYCCVQSGSTIVHPEASDRSVTEHEVNKILLHGRSLDLTPIPSTSFVGKIHMFPTRSQLIVAESLHVSRHLLLHLYHGLAYGFVC